MREVRITNWLKSFERLGRRLAIAALVLIPLFPANPGAVQAKGSSLGAVYGMTNSASGNAVWMLVRSDDGTLQEAGTFPTGGLGAGSGLGSQGSLVFSADRRWLLVANAGSNDLSVFAALPDRLVLTDRVSSGGERPISLAVYQDRVYALNAGGSGNLAGFILSAQGKLSALTGSTRFLSNGGVGDAPMPAQASFSPDGSTLVVTEKASNLILTYRLGADGLLSRPTAHPSAGMTPFGFDFGLDGALIVSEAFGGAPDASAVSSYRLAGDDLQVISPSAPTHQTAACWVVTARNGKFAYATNAGSGSISGYRVNRDGSLTLLDEDGRTGDTGAGSSPIDAAVSAGGRYLYALTANAHTVVAFAIRPDGSITPLGQVDVPAGSLGLAAR